jgi:hypothetical protein
LKDNVLSTETEHKMVVIIRLPSEDNRKNISSSWRILVLGIYKDYALLSEMIFIKCVRQDLWS